MSLIEAMKSVVIAKTKVELEISRLSRYSQAGDAAVSQALTQLYTLEYVLERIYLRLNTLVVASYLDWASLALMVNMLKHAISRLGHLPPEIASQLIAIEGALYDLWANVEGPTDEDAERQLAQANDEARKIIAEAEEAAKRSRSGSLATPLGQA
ncbi:MAG: hypothetical protein ACP5HK_01590 [Acidilobus sp.]